MNVLIAGGGTGGHIFPAIAIGQAIQRQRQDANIHFVGTPYGMETRLIPEAGYPLITLPMRGFLGKGLKGKLALLWRLPISMLRSMGILIKYKPKVVIGVGGYASAPLLWTAALLRIPTMIQEQNAVPGMVNRLSGKFVRLACLGFPEAASHLACPTIHTGNPVRNGFDDIEPWSPQRKTILVLGGSQGAAALNRDMPGLLKQQIPAQSDLKVVHQCGVKQVEQVRQAYAGAEFQYEVTPFIDNMSQMLEHVLFAVCRAGASTIAELKLARIPALLVPYPHAAHDHQTLNARSLADLGAALLVPEPELAQSGSLIHTMITDVEKLQSMASAHQSAPLDSAAACARIALALQQKQEVKDIVKDFETHVSQD